MLTVCTYVCTYVYVYFKELETIYYCILQKYAHSLLDGSLWCLLLVFYNTYSFLFCSYCVLLQSTSPFEKHIQRDLTRTFPEHDFFKNGPGQEALQNILKVCMCV